MPSRHHALTPSIAAATIEAALAGDGRDLVGIEVEWPVHHVSGPAARARIDVLQRACREPLPAGGRATVEPGGQMELSTLPAKTMDDAINAAHVDAEVLRSRLLLSRPRGSARSPETGVSAGLVRLERGQQLTEQRAQQLLLVRFHGRVQEQLVVPGQVREHGIDQLNAGRRELDVHTTTISSDA